MTCRMCKDEGNQIGGRKGWGLGDRETVSCVLKNKRSLGQSPGRALSLSRQRHRDSEGKTQRWGALWNQERLAEESLRI